MWWGLWHTGTPGEPLRQLSGAAQMEVKRHQGVRFFKKKREAENLDFELKLSFSIGPTLKA